MAQLGSFSNGGLGFGMAVTLHDEFTDVANQIDRSMEQLDATADAMARGVEKSLSMITKGFKAFALGSALLAPFVANLGNYSDLQESISKSIQVFGSEVDTVNDFVYSQADAMGQSRQQAFEAIGTFGNLLTSLGLGRDVAADYSITLNKLASDLASFNNTSVDDAVIALRSGMTGELEALKKFGVAINAEMIKQEAVAMGLSKNISDRLEPVIKMQAIYSLIMKQTTNAQGDFIRTSGGYANSLRILEARWTNFKTLLGGTLMPLATMFINVFSRALKAAESFLSSPIGKAIMTLVAGLGLVLATGGAVLILTGTLRLGLLKLAGVFGAAAKQSIVLAIANRGLAGGLRATARAAWAAITPLLPYIAIAAAVIAPIALMVLTIRKATSAFNEMEGPATGFLGFMQKLGGYIAVIREVWSSWSSLTKTFTLTEGLRSKLESLGILEFALNLATWVVRIKEFFSGIGQGISEAWGMIKEAFNALRPIFTVALNFLDKLGFSIGANTSSIDKWREAGRIAGIIIVGILGAVAIAFAAMAVSAVISMLPIIAVIALIGLAIWGVLKVAEKWNEWWDSLKDWGSRMWEAGKNIVKNLWDGMKSMMADFVSWIEDKITSIPIIGDLYEAGKFLGQGAAFLGGEVFSAVTGADNPIAAPEIPDIGVKEAQFNGNNAAARVVNNNNVTVQPAPVQINNKIDLDGQVLYENVKERASFDNDRN